MREISIDGISQVFVQHLPGNTRRAIGSSNASVVDYHFGSRDDLILAIFRHREPWLNQRRGEIYREFSRSHGQLELEQLLYTQWHLLFEQVVDECMHSFAGFLPELLRTPSVKVADVSARKSHLKAGKLKVAPLRSGQ